MNYLNGHKITLRFASEQITFFLNDLKKTFLLLIMLLAGKNIDRIVGNFINKPVLIIDSSRPISRKLMFKRFRLSNSFKRISCNIFYQFFYSLEDFFIGRFPFVKVIKSFCVKIDNCNHSESASIFFTLPFSISAIPSSKNFLFAGFPRRYSVSSFEASELSETVISRTLPLNIFLRPFIKSMLSSSFFSVNVFCIVASAFLFKYKCF